MAAARAITARDATITTAETRRAKLKTKARWWRHAAAALALVLPCVLAVAGPAIAGGALPDKALADQAKPAGNGEQDASAAFSEWAKEKPATAVQSPALVENPSAAVDPLCEPARWSGKRPELGPDH